MVRRPGPESPSRFDRSRWYFARCVLASSNRVAARWALASAQGLVVISPSARITSPRPTTIHQTV